MMTEYHISVVRETVEKAIFIVQCSSDEAAQIKAQEIEHDLENHGTVSQDEPEWELESEVFEIEEVV